MANSALSRRGWKAAETQYMVQHETWNGTTIENSRGQAFSDRCWDLLVGHEHKIASGPVPGFSGSFREARHAQDERRPVPAGKLKNASEMDNGDGSIVPSLDHKGYIRLYQVYRELWFPKCTDLILGFNIREKIRDHRLEIGKWWGPGRLRQTDDGFSMGKSCRHGCKWCFFLREVNDLPRPASSLFFFVHKNNWPILTHFFCLIICWFGPWSDFDAEQGERRTTAEGLPE